MQMSDISLYKTYKDVQVSHFITKTMCMYSVYEGQRDLKGISLNRINIHGRCMKRCALFHLGWENIQQFPEPTLAKCLPLRKLIELQNKDWWSNMLQLGICLFIWLIYFGNGNNPPHSLFILHISNGMVYSSGMYKRNIFCSCVSLRLYKRLLFYYITWKMYINFSKSYIIVYILKQAELSALG